MPKMACMSCGFTTTLSRKAAEIGMICPECNGPRLRPPIKARPGRSLSTFRPVTVRALVAGVLCLLSGPPILLMGLHNLHGKAGYLWARAVAFGILLLVGAVVFIIAGIVSAYKDLK